MRCIEIFFALMAAVLLLVLCPVLEYKSVMRALIHEDISGLRAFKVTAEAKKNSRYEAVLYEEPIEVSPFEYYTDTNDGEGAFIRYGY